jgi:hypothetical protein
LDEGENAYEYRKYRSCLNHLLANSILFFAWAGFELDHSIYLSIHPFTAMMKLNISDLRNLFGGLGIVGMIALLAPQTLLAQSATSSESLQNWQQNRSSDDLGNVFGTSESTSGGMNSMMNLINRLQNADPRSPSEISADQQENINSEAAAFRNRQQQQLQVAPANGAPNSTSPQ